MKHPDDFEVNDFYDLVRNVGGDLVEQIKLFDKFSKGNKHSMAFRIVYRSMDKTLEKVEVNQIHDQVVKAVQDQLKVTVR